MTCRWSGPRRRCTFLAVERRACAAAAAQRHSVIPPMGIDALDMHFRLEKSFGVKIEKGFWDRMPRGEVVEPARWWSCDRFVKRSSTSKWRYERRVPVVTAGDVH